MDKCFKTSLEDSYFMPVSHPIIQLLDQEEKELKKYTELQIEHKGVEWRIRDTLMSQYLKQRKELYAYGAEQIYFAKECDSKKRQDENQSDYMKAVAWRNVGTLTSLDALRLIQKVKTRFARGGLSGGKSEIHIAYIGEIKNQEQLQRYFKEASQNRNSVDKLPSTVLFTRLIRKREYGDYVFFREGENSVERKCIYNLASPSDMQELFGSFDIVLFLDESYFYKQRQTAKSLSERELKKHIQWCWKEMEREEQTDGSHSRSFRNKRRSYYKEIYNEAGLLMNGYGKDMSSKLGFDQELFRIMQQAACEQSDIYIYISRGNAIGDIDLTKQSVCNDEQYDGKRLFVYKLTKTIDGENSSVINEVKGLLDVDEPLVNKEIRLAEIDLWKLSKSIGENFYKEYFNNFSYRSMEIWEKTFLDIYVDIDDHKKLYWKLRYTSDDMQGAEKQILKEFVETYLSICQDDEYNKEPLSYAKDYLCDLLTRAMVARAKSAMGLFYAYLLRRDFIDIRSIDKGKEDRDTNADKKAINGTSRFRGRRLIYSAINGLDHIIVRDMEKRVDILKYDFRYEYCPEIDESTFLQLLEKIKLFCENTGYMDSRLYLLTK